MRLHINIDHVATLRNARGTPYPDPLEAAEICLAAGADGITAHLREDRRHIKDDDVVRLRALLTSVFNLEMAATAEMVEIARKVRPNVVTLVPERREERTTEGGLDVVGGGAALSAHVRAILDAKIRVSIFIAPDAAQVEAAASLGAQQVELHTGEYAHATGRAADGELERLGQAAERASRLGLDVAAGHGLTRANVGKLVRIPQLAELNIGHAVVADALFLSLRGAVLAMREAVERGKNI